MNEILSLLTSTMSIHLNSGQRLIINSPNMFIYMSMEMISAEGLLNKKIQLPSQFSSNFDRSSTLSLRVCSEDYGHYSIKIKLNSFSNQF